MYQRRRAAVLKIFSIDWIIPASFNLAYLYVNDVYLYMCGCLFAPRIFHSRWPMKSLRHNAIRDLLGDGLVANQDELRRKLRRRGFAVTQATLSRDIHELRLFKGPGGYSIPNGNDAALPLEDNSPPSLAEMMEGFGLRAQRAMNQVVLTAVAGGAQPLAAALDRAGWSEVVGTIAGDDTVLVICSDHRRAGDVETRLRKMLES